MIGRHELMIDDGRNLPIIPYRFQSGEDLTEYKRLCEMQMHAYYLGNAPLPLPESVAISVLRANIAKRYEHQISVEASPDDVKDEDVERLELRDLHNQRIEAGESIAEPLSYFMDTNIDAIETGFRISVGQQISPFDDSQARLSAAVVAAEYNVDDVHFGKSSSIKVTRLIRDRRGLKDRVVLKTKNGGIFLKSADSTIESVGRRTGTVVLDDLSKLGRTAAKVLAITGGSKFLDEEHREEQKDILAGEIIANPDIYEPILDRYYFARRDDDR